MKTDSDGWTVRVRKPGRGLLHRLVIAVAGLAVIAGPLAAIPRSVSLRMVPTAHIEPDGRIVKTWPLDFRADEGPCSDVGIRLRAERPDDPANWRGIVRAGGPQNRGEFGCWIEQEIGASTNAVNIAYARNLIAHFWKTYTESERRDLPAAPDTSNLEAARYAWLLERGAAGWRTIESNVERGKDARHHWDVWRGARSGWTVGPEGWTHHTACGGQREMDSILERFVRMTPEERGLTATWSVSALGWKVNANTHANTTVIYVADASATPAGSDSNNGLTTGAPKLTISAAKGATANGDPDWILFARVSNWANQQLGMIAWDGLNADNPYVVGSYGTGARPRFDTRTTSFYGNNDGSFMHLEDLDIWSSTYTGHSPASGVIGFNFIGGGAHGSHGSHHRFENCRVTALNAGFSISNGGGSDPMTNLTIRRCVIRQCFAIDQSSGGVYSSTGSDLTLEENVIDHNGWNDTTTVRTGTAQTGSSSTITLDSGASTGDDVYKGCAVTITSGTGSGQTRTVNTYVGSTRVATMYTNWGTAPDNTSAFSIVGAGRNIYSHNVYAHYSGNSGYICRRNISCRSSDHGLGRAHGLIYHNFCEDCITGILCRRGSGTTGSNHIYQNSVIGLQTFDYVLFPMFQAIGCIETDGNDVDGVTQTVEDNAVANTLIDGAYLGPAGITVRPCTDGSVIVQNNVAYDICNTNVNRYDNGIGFSNSDGRTGCTLAVTNNKIWMRSGAKWGFYASSSGYSSVGTWTGNQIYRGGGSSTGFFNTTASGDCNYTQFNTDVSGTGQSFTDPAFSSPGRQLGDWHDASTGGSGADLDDALTLLTGFDRATGSWKRKEHDATWCVNYNRIGFGMDPISVADLPYPIPARTAVAATASAPNINVTWDANDSSTGPTSDIAALSLRHASSAGGSYSEVASVAGSATSASDPAPGNGTWYEKVVPVDWLGVDHTTSAYDDATLGGAPPAPTVPRVLVVGGLSIGVQS